MRIQLLNACRLRMSQRNLQSCASRTLRRFCAKKSCDDSNALISPTLLPIPRKLARPVGIMTLAQFMNNLGFGCAIPVLPFFAVEMGLGASGVGAFIATSALGRFIFNIPFGALSDRVGRKPLMLGGTLTTSVASFLTAASTGPGMLLCSRFLLGMGGSASMAGGQAYMADVSAEVPQHRGKILGLQSTIITLAFAVGPAIGGLLYDMYGARMCFCIVGAASAGAALTLRLLAESRPASAIMPLHAALRPAQGEEGDKKSAWEVYGPLLRNPDRQGLMASQFAVFCSYAALMTIFPLHAFEVLNTSMDASAAAGVGAMFSSGALMGFLGAPLGGWMADSIGRKMTVFPGALLITSGMVLCTLPASAAASEAIALGASPHSMLMASILVWGLGNGMSSPGLHAFAADIADEDSRGKALALSRQASDFALFVGPIAFGSIAHMFDTSTALWSAAAVIVSANAFFGVRSTERRVRPQERAEEEGEEEGNEEENANKDPNEEGNANKDRNVDKEYHNTVKNNHNADEKGK